MASLSVIIPLYNEEKNVAALLCGLHALRQEGLFQEIECIFVNDGSTDGTEALLRQGAAAMPGSVVLSHTANRGKGYAVRQGMLAAHGDWRLMADADLSVPLSEARRLLPYMEKGCDVVIGSRALSESSVPVPQGLLRRKLGRAFSMLANATNGLGVSDVTCGFKCFSGRAAEQIFPRAQIDRWAYDAEILFLARKCNLKIAEMPVRWSNGPGTRVRLLRDIPGCLRDLARIRFLHRHAHGT